eukprot:Pgem_evm1s1683
MNSTTNKKPITPTRILVILCSFFIFLPQITQAGSNNKCASEPDSQPGCSNAQCEQLVCATDRFCCTTAWDNTCIENSLKFFVCACEGAERGVVFPDPILGPYYYFCDYDTRNHRFYKCPRDTDKLLSANGRAYC